MHDVYPALMEPPARRPAVASPRLVYAGRVGFGILWRIALIAAAVLLAADGLGPPWYAVILFVVGGLALGLWRRRSRLARLWRMTAVAASVAYLAPLTPVALPATEAGFGIAVLAPWLAARRRG